MNFVPIFEVSITNVSTSYPIYHFSPLKMTEKCYTIFMSKYLPLILVQRELKTIFEEKQWLKSYGAKNGLFIPSGSCSFRNSPPQIWGIIKHQQAYRTNILTVILRTFVFYPTKRGETTLKNVSSGKPYLLKCVKNTKIPSAKAEYKNIVFEEGYFTGLGFGTKALSRLTRNKICDDDAGYCPN